MFLWVPPWVFSLSFFPFPSWEAGEGSKSYTHRDCDAQYDTLSLPVHLALSPSAPLPHSLPDLSGIRSWSDCAYRASEME